MANEANTLWITGYTDDGFKVSVTLAISDASQIGDIVSAVRAQGIQPTPPPAQPATDRMTITSITRRLWTGKDGKEKHAVDFFADYLQWRVFTVYMDSMDDIEAFEAGSGLQIGSIPVLPIGAPPERNAADKNQISCAFDVLYQSERTEDGKRRDSFVGYANAPAPASPAKVTPMPTQSKQNNSASANNSTHWANSYEEAKAFNSACARYGFTMSEVLQWIEDEPLEKFRDISITKYEALKRLKDRAERPAQPTTTSAMIDEAAKSTKNKAQAVAEQFGNKGKANAESPLNQPGTVPPGFQTSDPISDVPF